MPFDAMPEIFAWYKNEEEGASTEKNLQQNKAEWEGFFWNFLKIYKKNFF